MQPGGGSELAVDIELAFGKLLDGVELISGDLDSLTLELAGVGIRQRADLHRFDSESIPTLRRLNEQTISTIENPLRLACRPRIGLRRKLHFSMIEMNTAEELAASPASLVPTARRICSGVDAPDNESMCLP